MLYIHKYIFLRSLWHSFPKIPLTSIYILPVTFLQKESRKASDLKFQSHQTSSSTNRGGGKNNYCIGHQQCLPHFQYFCIHVGRKKYHSSLFPPWELSSSH